MSSEFVGRAPSPRTYEMPPPGQHTAVCIGFVDLGYQEQIYKDLKGERREDIHQIMLCWELTGLPIAGQAGHNHIVGRSYNLKFGLNKDDVPGALRKLMEQFKGCAYKVGEDIDPVKLLGKKYLIGLLHKESWRGKMYAKLDAVNPLPKEMTCLPAKIKPILVLKEDALPEWVPWLFGERVEDVRARAIPPEMVGKPRTTRAPQQPAGHAPAGSEQADDEEPF